MIHDSDRLGTSASAPSVDAIVPARRQGSWRPQHVAIHGSSATIAERVIPDVNYHRTDWYEYEYDSWCLVRLNQRND